VYLRELTWPAVDPTALLVVPLGSTEQHGPHLPFTTDTDLAEELARRLAAAYPDALVAPAIPYGSAGEHASFPGTLSIGQEALAAVLVELVRSSHFARTLFVNGHGGNQQPVARAVAVLTAEGHDVLAWSPSLPGGDAHAGRTETSLLLSARPDLVGDFRAASGNQSPLAELMPALQAGRLRDVAPTGVLGDPAAASAAEGHAWWTTLDAQLLDAVVRHWAAVGAS
jgi:mycofactocin system creatininase family protein